MQVYFLCRGGGRVLLVRLGILSSTGRFASFKCIHRFVICIFRFEWGGRSIHILKIEIDYRFSSRHLY